MYQLSNSTNYAGTRTVGIRSSSAFRIILFSLSPLVFSSARNPASVAAAITDSQKSVDAGSPDDAMQDGTQNPDSACCNPFCKGDKCRVV